MVLKTLLLLAILPSYAVLSLSLSPTTFPTFDSSSQIPMHPLELDEWQFVYNALHGPDWLYCKGESAFEDPCSYAPLSCSPPIRIVCDQQKHLIELVLTGNQLRGDLPIRSLLVLGVFLRELDFSNNALLKLPSSMDCAPLPFCHQANKSCKFDFPVCDLGTGIVPPNFDLNVYDAYIWETLVRQWKVVGSVRPYCANSEYLECVVANNLVYISEIRLGGLGLKGELPFQEETFSLLRELRFLDLHGNSLSAATNDGDCVRLDSCLTGQVDCDFSNSGLTLCSPRLPVAASPRVRLVDELVVYWDWFLGQVQYDVVTLATYCPKPYLFRTDPCNACPMAIVCVPIWRSNTPVLVVERLQLKNFGLRGVVSFSVLTRFFDMGLTKVDFQGNPDLVSSSASCWDPPAVCVDCHFGSGIPLCNSRTPTTIQVATLQPSLSQTSPCSRTTGGFAPERTLCAIPFTYKSVVYKSCLSFVHQPPFVNDSALIPREPRFPTNLWCPTQASYTRTVANDWGFCDCVGAFTSRPSSNAPTGLFSLQPTLRPTTDVPTIFGESTLFPTTPFPTPRPRTKSPTSLSPTFAPSAASVLLPSELTAWQQIFDSLNGLQWTHCSNARNDPCGLCSRGPVNVTCVSEAATTRRRQLVGEPSSLHITEIHLADNHVVGTLSLAHVLGLARLVKLDLSGAALTLSKQECDQFCVQRGFCSLCGVFFPTSSPTFSPFVASAPPPADMTGMIVGIVFGVLLFLLLVGFCVYKRWKKKSVSTNAEKGVSRRRMTDSLSVTAPSSEFLAMAKRAQDAELPPASSSVRFSLLRQRQIGNDSQDNKSLEEAKLQALHLDDMARKDFADLDDFLANLELQKYGPSLRARAMGQPFDINFLFKLTEAKMKEIGMTIGERVRLKRALQIRGGMAKDPVFGDI